MDLIPQHFSRLHIGAVGDYKYGLLTKIEL